MLPKTLETILQLDKPLVCDCCIQGKFADAAMLLLSRRACPRYNSANAPKQGRSSAR
ncbi:hypothetical protein Z949_1050 [Sulfitobacter guttiformis KCTC 32187]|nr:hypothetical protein Z949_1050 [Sulfitobacter guttiformis KCTC 32187]